MSELSSLQLTGDIFNTPQFKDEFEKVYDRIINDRNEFLSAPRDANLKARRNVIDRFLNVSADDAYKEFIIILQKLSNKPAIEREFLRMVGTEAASTLANKIIKANKEKEESESSEQGTTEE